jgi:hypothetical protein
MEKKISRGHFMETAIIGASSVVGFASIPAFGFCTIQTNKLAILGG